MPRRRPEFAPGVAGAEAAKLKKFSDAGGTQIQWLSDAGRNDSSITSGISEVPWIDEPMRNCLAKLYPDAAPPKALTLLPERVKELSQIQSMIVHAEKHRVRDCALGVLATALWVGLAVGTVFGFLAHAIIGTVILEASLCYLLYCHLKATKMAAAENRKGQPLLSFYPLAVILSPLVLSYYLISREPVLKNAYHVCQQEIQSYKEESKRYWSAAGEKLEQRLQLEKERVTATLTLMQKQPIRTPEGEKRVSEYKDLIEKAITETGKGQRFRIL